MRGWGLFYLLRKLCFCLQCLLDACFFSFSSCFIQFLCVCVCVLFVYITHYFFSFNFVLSICFLLVYPVHLLYIQPWNTYMIRFYYTKCCHSDKKMDVARLNSFEIFDAHLSKKLQFINISCMFYCSRSSF